MSVCVCVCVWIGVCMKGCEQVWVYAAAIVRFTMCTITHAVPLEPVVTCCDVSAETLDAILELLSEHNKELLQEVQRKEKVLARRNRQTELMSKPNIDGPFEVRTQTLISRH